MSPSVQKQTMGCFNVSINQASNQNKSLEPFSLTDVSGFHEAPLTRVCLFFIVLVVETWTMHRVFVATGHLAMQVDGTVVYPGGFLTDVGHSRRFMNKTCYQRTQSVYLALL